MKIREYKIRNLALLAQLQDKLPQKYGSEIEDIMERLIVKTHGLRIYTLGDYIVTVMHLSKKYPELKVLLPSAKQVEGLLKEKEEGGEGTSCSEKVRIKKWGGHVVELVPKKVWTINKGSKVGIFQDPQTGELFRAKVPLDYPDC